MENITIDIKNQTLSDNIIAFTPIWHTGVRTGRELKRNKKLMINIVFIHVV